MASLIAQQRELARQEATQDTEFLLGAPPYAFELRVPRKLVAGGPNAFVFQLPIGLASFESAEPFLVTATNVVEGLHTQNRGIVQRRLRGTGTTGWKPRPARYSVWQNVVLNGNRSWSRAVTGLHTYEAVSGLRHLQYLQDGLVRLYSDLKADPESNPETTLIWHDLKHDEHWVVELEDFSYSRESVLYNYSFALLTIAPAGPLLEPAAAEPGFLAKVLDVIADVREKVDMIQAALDDVLAFVEDIRAFVAEIESVISDVLGLVEVVSGFLAGVADVITLPLEFASNLLLRIADIADTLEAIPDIIPDQCTQSMRRLEDAIDGLVARREIFSSDAVTADTRRAGLSDRPSAELAGAPTTTSLQAMRSQPQGPEPGDAVRARYETGDGLPAFTGVRSAIVNEGDTLETLASKHLGNSALGFLIATLNDLRAPYVSATGAPGTLRTGQTVLIPSTTAPSTALASPGVYGSRRSSTAEERVLGVDVMQRRDSRGFYDIVIDPRSSTDVLPVRGVACLQQALAWRADLDAGDDPMFPSVGRLPTILDHSPSVRVQMSAYGVAAAVGADPRVAAVRSRRTETVGDTVVANLVVEVRGLAQALQIEQKV